MAHSASAATGDVEIAIKPADRDIELALDAAAAANANQMAAIKREIQELEAQVGYAGLPRQDSGNCTYTCATHVSVRWAPIILAALRFKNDCTTKKQKSKLGPSVLSQVK
jgi:hypothetical protein